METTTLACRHGAEISPEVLAAARRLVDLLQEVAPSVTGADIKRAFARAAERPPENEAARDMLFRTAHLLSYLMSHRVGTDRAPGR